jgi:hypothetical protein
MGAQVFSQTVWNADMRKAFNLARDEAAYEHGHGGYTGTVAEKGEVVKVRDIPMTEQDANNEAWRMIDARDHRTNDKWGPAGAIPLTKTPNGTQIDGWLFFGWASS